MRVPGLAGLLLWFAFFAAPVGAQEQVDPKSEPILRVDAGMHTAAIRRIASNKDCSLLATGSEDKSVRIWRLPMGRLMSTLRPPLGDDNDGKIYAVAMSPDGSWVAAGGWNRTGSDHWVYIFDVQGGSISARFGPYQNIEHLAVSQNGKYLAAALRGGDGIRMWERTGSGSKNWRLVLEDKIGNGADVKAVEFDRTGTLYAVAYDGNIRRYTGPTQSAAIATARSGKRPYSVSVHPSGDRIAVGFADTTAVEIFETKSLRWMYSADTRGLTRGNLQATSWSADGNLLYAAGGLADQNQHPIRVWDKMGRGAARQLPGPTDTVFHLMPCTSGVALSSGDPAFGIIDQAGKRVFWQGRVGADMRGKLRQHFTVSADATRVRFGLEQAGEKPVLFDVNSQRLIEAPDAPAGLTPADTGSAAVSNWENSTGIKVGARPLRLDRNERSQSLAIASGKQVIVVGTDNYLRAYDDTGKYLWRLQAPGVVWGVNVSPERRIVVAAFGDGTIRWYNLDEGKELLALFVHVKDMRWVAWTPKGFYSASAGGEDLIGWHINRGWTQAADFFPAYHFREQFYRPDITRQVLASLDEERAIDEANQTAKRQQEARDIGRARIPPVVRAENTQDQSRSPDGKFDITYTVRSPSGVAVKRMIALVDGRIVEGRVPEDHVRAPHLETRGVLSISVPSGRDVTVSIMAETENAFSTAASITIRGADDCCTAKPLPAPSTTLYALVIGVDRYEKIGRLDFADDDAVSFAQYLQTQKSAAYRDVQVRLLTTRESREPNEQPSTKTNIELGLDWLKNSMKDVDGVALIYFSGHGHTLADGTSYLLPANFDGESYIATALSKASIVSAIQGMGKVFLFVDACHAAGGLALDTADFVNSSIAARNNSVFAFASSMDRQASVGDAVAKSLYTKIALEGLLGKAADNNDKQILTVDLDRWLTRQVYQRSKQRQFAIMNKSPGAAHTVVAIIH